MIRVLLADDHAVVRAGLEELLRSTDGIEVVGAAADGGEAVRIAAEQRPDVVLMDLAAPGVDGIEATRRRHRSVERGRRRRPRRSPTASGSCRRSTRARSATC